MRPPPVSVAWGRSEIMAIGDSALGDRRHVRECIPPGAREWSHPGRGMNPGGVGFGEGNS